MEIGHSPSIEALAAGIVGNERKRLLQELIALDVIYRRKQGETPSVGEYLERFEDLDGPPLVELINSLMAIHATKAVPPSIFFADWSFGTRESPATEIGLPRLR